MITTLKPQAQVLSIWRILLCCAMFPVAFACSFLFTPGQWLWNTATAAWVLVFLFFYLLYFPIRYKNLALAVDGRQFMFRSGVFERRLRSVPFDNIAFATLSTSPLHRMWGLTTLVLVSAGGRMRMSGLKKEDAARIVSILFDE